MYNLSASCKRLFIVDVGYSHRYRRAVVVVVVVAVDELIMLLLLLLLLMMMMMMITMMILYDEYCDCEFEYSYNFDEDGKPKFCSLVGACQWKPKEAVPDFYVYMSSRPYTKSRRFCIAVEVVVMV